MGSRPTPWNQAQNEASCCRCRGLRLVHGGWAGAHRVGTAKGVGDPWAGTGAPRCGSVHGKKDPLTA